MTQTGSYHYKHKLIINSTPFGADGVTYNYNSCEPANPQQHMYGPIKCKYHKHFPYHVLKTSSIAYQPSISTTTTCKLCRPTEKHRKTDGTNLTSCTSMFKPHMLHPAQRISPCRPPTPVVFRHQQWLARSLLPESEAGERPWTMTSS